MLQFLASHVKDLHKLIKQTLIQQSILLIHPNKTSLICPNSVTLPSPRRCNQRGTTTTTTSYVQLRHKVCVCIVCALCVECVTWSDLRIRICLAYVFINLT